MKKNKSGFTIVELLIVIVVIAILAVIGIVAYSGIQTRAENTKTISAVNAYVKAIKSYASLKGTYPSDPTWPCLGAIGTSCARQTSNACSSMPDGGSSSVATFNTQLSEVFAGELPSLSAQITGCEGATYKGGYFRGTTGKDGTIVYFLKGNQSCDGVTGFTGTTRIQSGDVTRCQVIFAALP